MALRKNLPFLALAVLALSACGSQRDLRPKPGHQLPIAPYGRAERPSAAELIAAPSQARPGRNIELHQRSEDRPDDPFDLPPRD